MKLNIIGCSHHNSSVAIRERLAFSPRQTELALDRFRSRFPRAESVLLSTCNRVELYAASDDPACCPSHSDLVEFIAEFHGLDPVEIFDDLFERTGEDAMRHLFTVAASLDSMVVGEAQILSQVKRAYELATARNNTGPLTHSAFQAAMRVAKRVASETAIQQKRVSIPSVAVADFAKSIFERFHDKRVLVIGAGDMGEETVRYLIDEGARAITIVNRNPERAIQLAARMKDVLTDASRVEPWDRLRELLVEADLVVSTTGASQPIIATKEFQPLVQKRYQRPIFILDLAIPRDFEAGISDLVGVYLYCIDDLTAACDANRKARNKEWPKAQKIIEDETQRFMADLNHRTTGPTIRRLKNQAGQLKETELQRLLKRLGDVDDKTRNEIERSFDRLVNKLLHPPLESLRDEAQGGSPHGLIEALVRLFQLKD